MPTLIKEPEKITEGKPKITGSPEWFYANVGDKERSVRLLVGVGALIAAIEVESVLATVVFGIVAVAGILTGASGYCLINRLLGRNTARHAGR